MKISVSAAGGYIALSSLSLSRVLQEVVPTEITLPPLSLVGL